MTGLDLEEQQYALEALFHLMLLTYFLRRQLQLEVLHIKGPQTSKQLADLKDKHTSLRNQIQVWREAQLVYTPCVTSLVQSLLASPDLDMLLPTVLAESIPLHLPSSLPQCLRQLPKLATVLEKEHRLRIAQAHDALADI